jgi:general secretion pathway protein D
VKAPAPAAQPAPAAAAAAPVPGLPNYKPGGVMMNFQGASLTDVLNYLSEAAGFVIVQETPVSGTVNIVSKQSLSTDETVDLLNTVLAEKGYAAIRNGRILKIVSRRDVQRKDLPVIMGSDPEQIPRKDEVVTQILPLMYGEAAKLVENLRPLLPETATISSNDASNAILMTDTQTNIRRMAMIIKALDTSVSSKSTLTVFPLQYSDAKEVATTITSLFTSTTATSGGSDRGRGRGFGGFPGFGGPGGPGGAPGGTPSSGQSEARTAASRVVAVADEQSNSLIVSAPEEMTAMIREIINQIDTSVTGVTDTRIFRLKHADAVELATLVNSLQGDATTDAQNQGRNGRRGGFGQNGFGGFGGQPQQGQGSQMTQRELMQAKVVAVGDPRTNSLIVTAGSGAMAQIEEIVTRLDATDAKKQRVFVHSLEHADAENVANVLRGMLGQQVTGSAATMSGTNRLIERTANGANIDAADAFSQGGGGGTGGRR